MAAHIEAEEMAGGVCLASRAGGLGIKSGGMMIVAVSRVDIITGEFVKIGEGVGDLCSHRASEKFIKGREIGEAAIAFERFEKVTRVDVALTLIGMMLKKLLAGFGVAYTADNSEFCEV